MQKSYGSQQPKAETPKEVAVRQLKEAAAAFTKQLSKTRDPSPGFSERGSAEQALQERQKDLVETLCKWIEAAL